MGYLKKKDKNPEKEEKQGKLIRKVALSLKTNKYLYYETFLK